MRRFSAASSLTVLTPSLAFSQTPGAGRQVFATRCAACHGTEGAGGELGPSIVARIPLRSDQDLEAVIKDGLPGAGHAGVSEPVGAARPPISSRISARSGRGPADPSARMSP